jgi:dihydroorotate dehydrogenase (fumarate)
MAPRVSFTPPLFNSATPWASSEDDLTALYNSPHTGAVTTRTSLLHGFAENPSVHQKVLFPAAGTGVSSLNTFGYSPHPLGYYLDAINHIIKASQAPQTKPFIISVTGRPDEVKDAAVKIGLFARQSSYNLLIEINLSCPNIAGKPPPAYSLPDLLAYLSVLSEIELAASVPVGLKTPPYTHDGEYKVLLDALKEYPDVVSFVTSTNTLGSSLHLSSPPSLAVSEGGRRTVYQPTLSSETGTGIGGLGGACIHWLSLGNVATIRRLLNAEVGLRDIAIIGVGGVADRDSWERMLSVGAVAAAVGTALGDKRVGVFAEILGSVG